MSKQLHSDPFNCFFHDRSIKINGRAGAPLSGLTFAVKDLFDVEGVKSSAGNPDWLATHEAAQSNSWATQALLDQGATLTGKTHTDELAFSLNGENFHYGTPINPAAPERIPGGSSSGSAAAVAGGLVDLALGTDTGGSVRVPASYCGIYGIRTTHDRVNRQGLIPLAPIFDTIGWFARSASTFALAGHALMPDEDQVALAPKRLILLEDTFARISKEHRTQMEIAAEKIADVLGLSIEYTNVSSDQLVQWGSALRYLQFKDIWQTHGLWISEHNPKFGPGLHERFMAAKENAAKPEQVAIGLATKKLIHDKIDALLADGDALLGLPASAGVAPYPSKILTAMDEFRVNAMALTCISGMSGTPQVSLPSSQLEGLPVNFSLIGPRNSDKQMLSLCNKFSFWDQPIKTGTS